MGEALDVQKLVYPDGAGLADPADVVAAQVDQHHVLGPLFLIGPKLLLQGQVLRFVGATGPGPGDGVGRDAAALHLDQHLRRGANELEPLQVQVEHVGGGVDLAQRPIDVERVGGGLAAETLGDDGLDNIAGDDISLDAFDHGLELGLRHVGLDSAGRAFARQAGQRGLQRPGEALHDAIDPLHGVGIGGLDVAVEVGVADHFDGVLHVIKDDQGVGDHKDRFGQREGVRGRLG